MQKPIDLISPTIIERISWNDYRSNFDECFRKINEGTIFRVHGNEDLQKFYHTVIEPEQKSNSIAYFRENPENIYHNQALQKALFSGIQSLHQIYVDSIVRLRRTTGYGAFVGPHVDAYEALPLDGINFWVSFSKLQREQAIQFLPEQWFHKPGNARSFKPGQYIDYRNRVMPSLSLFESALSSEVEPCEILIFNSGRMVHCSPFFVGNERISADQRLFLYHDQDDFDFEMLPKFYRHEDLKSFTGDEETNKVLRSLWKGYNQEISSTETLLCRESAEITQAEVKSALYELGGEIATALAAKSKLRLSGQYVENIISQEAQSGNILYGLLRCNISQKYRRKICLKLLDFPPETCTSTYPTIAANWDPILIGQFAVSVKESIGARRSATAVGLLLSLAAINWLRRWRLIPNYVQQRSNGIISRRLLRLLHPDIYAMNVDIPKFNRALRYNGRLFSALPFIGGLRRVTKTPNFGPRARSILFALQRLKEHNRQTGNRVGQIAEFGVANGEGFRQLVILTMHYCSLHKLPIPYFYGFDTFGGLPETDDPSDAGQWDTGDYPGDLEQLNRFMEENNWDRHCRMIKGLFSASLQTMPESFSPDFILIDCDYYSSTRDVFENLKNKLKSGTLVYFDDIDSNFQNRYLGENRFIHELNDGVFGKNIICIKFYITYTFGQTLKNQIQRLGVKYPISPCKGMRDSVTFIKPFKNNIEHRLSFSPKIHILFRMRAYFMYRTERVRIEARRYDDASLLASQASDRRGVRSCLRQHYLALPIN